LKPRSLLEIQLGRTDVGVNDQDATRKLLPALEIRLNQGPPRLSLGLRALSIPISGQICKEKTPVNPEEVDLLCPPRSGTCSGQAFLPEKAINQTGFPDIRPAHKRNLGEGFLRKLAGVRGATDKLSGNNLQ
jgi:hypothetical protein